MASPSTSTPVFSANTDNFQKSHFQQTVCLVDWWLTKAENGVQGRRLGVAGLTDRGTQAMRVFRSAPILKRYDAFNLETDDGICVILNGLINKARTLENGFPSAVFIYFSFGFPPYWKDCNERFVGIEPLSKDLPGDKLVEQLSQQPESTEDVQPHVDRREEDFRSQGKTEANGMCEINHIKSLAVALPQGCGVSGLQKESCRGGTNVEDHTAPVLTVIFPENEVNSLLDSQCNLGIPGGGGTLSARHSYNKRTRGKADDLTKMGKKRTKTNSDWDMSSSEKILSHNKLSVMTRSMKKCEMNDQRSAGIAECEKITLNSVSSINYGEVGLKLVVHRESESRYSCNSEISGLDRNTEKVEFSLSDAASTKQAFDQIPETSSQNKGISGVETRSKTHKDINKATELCRTPATPTKSHHIPAAVDNQKRETVINGKSSLSKKAKALDSMTRQKSAPVSKKTPKREKDKGSSASSKSGSFSRSRSGRLLMPTLEFWRNQKAIYDADRTITGIEGVDS